jgi:hypothetical protein
MLALGRQTIKVSEQKIQTTSDYFHKNFHQDAREHALSQAFMGGQRRQVELEVLEFER